MATTRLSDVIVPEVYNSYEAINSPEKSDFVTSGVVVTNSGLNAKANEGGETLNMPFWKDLDSSIEANLSSSDPAVKATAQKVLAGKMVDCVCVFSDLAFSAILHNHCLFGHFSGTKTRTLGATRTLL